MSRTANAGDLLALALLVFSASCVTEALDSRETKQEVGPWLEPSPSLRQQIDDRVERLPWTHGMERVELIRWFALVGEPAYPALLELATDPRPDVAGAALAALGATGDSRLVEPMHELTWSYRLPKGVQFERARALVRLGDWSEVPVLIDGLEDEELMTRALCAKALSDLTRERFDYDARGTPEERAAAVARWREWWGARSADPFLADGEERTETPTSERP